VVSTGKTGARLLGCTKRLRYISDFQCVGLRLGVLAGVASG